MKTPEIKTILSNEIIYENDDFQTWYCTGVDADQLVWDFLEDTKPNTVPGTIRRYNFVFQPGSSLVTRARAIELLLASPSASDADPMIERYLSQKITREQYGLQTWRNVGVDADGNHWLFYYHCDVSNGALSHLYGHVKIGVKPSTIGE